MAGGTGKAKANTASKCASEGCGHPKDDHSDTGGGCWGEGTTCPCRGYAGTKDEAEAVATAGAVEAPTPAS